MSGGPDEARRPWDEHRSAQERSWLRSTAEQRLRWLEAALTLAYEAGVHPACRRGPAAPPPAATEAREP